MSAGAVGAATINVSPGESIQAAINGASSGDIIIVAQGTYNENLDIRRKAITVRSSDPDDPAVVAATIINGGGNGSVVKFACAEGPSSVLSGFTIRGGSSYDGGGITCVDASPTISNNVITQNSAKAGAGIFCDHSSPTIIGNTIIANQASYYGGGIHCESSSPTITNNTISGNSAGQFGGGFCCFLFSSPSITNTIIAYNGFVGEVNVGDPSIDHPSFKYCDVWNDMGLAYLGLPDQIGSNGNISVNPLFADSANGNFRLKSAGGRWNGSAWVYDPVSSPCLDAGDPASDYAGEPSYNGGRINMGFDGNTSYASKTNRAPSMPDSLVINPAGPYVSDTITAIASGSNDPEGSTPSHKYQWRLKGAKEVWGEWGYDSTDGALSGVTLHKDEVWAVHACATDGDLDSAWTTPVEVTILNSAPTRPAWVSIDPAVPGKEDLTGVASGSNDADTDGISYEYQWAKLSPTGEYLTKWADNPGEVLSADKVSFGDIWRVRARAFDGTDYSLWKAHKTVKIVRMVSHISPGAGAVNVPLNSPIYVSFRWPVDQASVNQRLRVYRGTALVHGLAKWVTPNLRVRFTPTRALTQGTAYEVRLASGIACTSGRVLGWGEEYDFQTAAATGARALSVAAAPTSLGAQVTVNLSSAATVRTVVCNIAGRVVAELAERELPAGVSSLVWNGMSRGGSKVPAGCYLVRVEAKGSEGAVATAMVPLQVR